MCKTRDGHTAAANRFVCEGVEWLSGLWQVSVLRESLVNPFSRQRNAGRDLGQWELGIHKYLYPSTWVSREWVYGPGFLGLKTKGLWLWWLEPSSRQRWHSWNAEMVPFRQTPPTPKGPVLAGVWQRVAQTWKDRQAILLKSSLPKYFWHMRSNLSSFSKIKWKEKWD